MGSKSGKKRGAAETSPATNHPAGPNGGAESQTIAELRRLLEYRSLMLANYAHDLRTPLTAILGFAEILVDFEELTESQKILCERIQNSGRELQSTINLLSDLSRLELDNTAVVLREFSLAHTLQELCSAFSRKAKKKKVSLMCRVEDGLGNVVSDESKLRQVLYNFFACAIARSPLEGQVNISASVKDGRVFAVKIEDEGEFFDVARGFDFLDAGPARDKRSLQRIGLDISQRLVKALGGTITLENREPHGLSIVLQMPAGR